MALVPFTITAIERDLADAVASGKQVIVGAVCSLFVQPSDVVAQLYDNANGDNGNTAKVTNSNGQVTVWVEPGDYRVSVNSNDSFVSLQTGGEIVTQSITETQTLAALQTTVALVSLSTTRTAFYINGAGVDNGRLVLNVDYTLSSTAEIELTTAYPSGTLITAVQNDGTEAVFSDVKVFDNIAEMVSDTGLVIGDYVVCKRYYVGGGLVDGLFFDITSDSVNGFSALSLVNGNTATLIVGDKVCTTQLGTNRLSTDYLALIFAVNNPSYRHVEVDRYSPEGGSVYVDRDNIIIDCMNSLLDFTGVGHPMLILGQTSGGGLPASSRVNIDVRNVRTAGDKTAGSMVSFYRRVSTCTQHNWKAWFLDTAFSSDGEPQGANESICCEFYNMDLRFCNVGFNDPTGAFQGSTFFGGRIEGNLREGVLTKSPNINFEGTVIEGNVTGDGAFANIRLIGGGGFKLLGCYMERKLSNPLKAFISVDDDGAPSTRRVSIYGTDFYGQDAAGARIVQGLNWTTGSLSIKDCNIVDCLGFVLRGGSVGNWIGSFDSPNSLTESPEDGLNGARYIENDRVRGFTGNSLTAKAGVKGKTVLVEDTDSEGTCYLTQRFIGRIATGGVGIWEDVISTSEIRANSGVSVSVQLTFLSRSGDLYFVDNLIIVDGATIAFNDNIIGNYGTTSYRISGGVLQVDNLPAANRDWSVKIETMRSALS